MRDSRLAVVVVAGALGLLALPGAAVSRAADLEYRVAFEPATQLERRLNDLARDGFACVAVARPEMASNVPGVAVILARTAAATGTAPSHRVVTGSRDGLKVALNRHGADGFRLCGFVFDEEPPNTGGVAVMVRTAAASWQYDTEVLLRYKDSLARLNTLGRDGFRPVAAAPIDNNRVPDSRNWMVVVERPASGGPAVEVTVRSGVGPSGLASSLNDAGKKGFQIDLAWKEGNDYVAMMSRRSGTSTPHEYATDGDAPNGVHALFRLALGDFPYLSSQRLFVTDHDVMASNELIEEPLPAPGISPDRAGDHLTRNRGYQVAYARVGRDRDGKILLSVVMVKRD
jgi:hypothetical protein